MVDEARLKQMTKVAMIEKKYSSDMAPVLKYGKKEYLNVCAMGSFFAGTLIFAMAFAGALIFAVGFKVENISLQLIEKFLFVGLAIYIVFIVCNIIVARHRARKRYSKGRRKVDDLTEEYEILHSMYRHK